MERLPNDYKLKENNGGNYFKITEEPQEFRILTSPILGYEYFAVDDDTTHPIRQKEPFDGIPGDSANGRPPREFWAFVIWNHTLCKIQIMEITQQTLKKEILKHVQDVDNWGDPKKYDFRIYRTGKGIDTRYFLSALPKSKFESEEMLNAAIEDASKVKLDALYDGADPFKPF